MTEADRSPWPRRVLWSAVALHVGLLWYFTDPALVTGDEPVLTYDYALHFYQVDRAVRALTEYGAFWSYDPFVLAGQPTGVTEDLTNKGAELFALALGGLGVPLARAMNLYVLLAHLGLPFAGWASARLFGGSRAVAAGTTLTWVLLWHFDSLMHWCWYVGMIAWATASYLVVLLAALTYRAVTDHRTRHYVATIALAPALAILHPFAVIPAAAPLAVIYVRGFKDLDRREHALAWLAVALTASTALIWAGPALLFRHYVGEVDAFLRPTPIYAVFDAFDLLHDVLMTGQPVRSMLRTLVLVLGAVALVGLRRDRDARFGPWAASIGFGVIVAYVGGLVWALLQTQPYRQLGPAMLMAALPAVTLVLRLARELPRPLPWQAKAVGAALGAIALARFAQTVVQYMPTLLPKRAVYAGMDRSPPQLPPAPEELPLIVLGHAPAPPEYREIRAYLEAHHGGRGRVVTMDWALGEYLAAFTTLPTLGGIPQRNVPHVDAHPLRHDLAPRGEGDDPLRRYLETYAAGWVVFMGPVHPIERRSDLVTPVARFGLHRLSRVVPEPSYVARGRATLTGQELNRLTFTGAAPEPLVLRFHWLETLECRPSCAIERVPVAGDRVGFIGIDHPPERFEIVNVYP